MTKLSARVDALEARQHLKIDIRSCSDDELYAQLGEGYDLSLMPGDTRDEKVGAVLAAADGKLTLTPEARHAARGWFDVRDSV